MREKARGQDSEGSQILPGDFSDGGVCPALGRTHQGTSWHVHKRASIRMANQSQQREQNTMERKESDMRCARMGTAITTHKDSALELQGNGFVLLFLLASTPEQ